MQQRRLRPGDVVDDYCPRERRVTDHAIVAMIDDDIKQTRCVSCDTEHEYKQARVPAQRRKKAAPALFTQVLDGLQGPARLAQQGAVEPPAAASPPPSPPPIIQPSVQPPTPAAEPLPPPAAAPASTDETSDEAAAESRGQEEGPVRRPLIRAQLPRHEGQQVPTREIPEFTIRQPSANRPNRPGATGGRPAGAGGRRRPGGHQGGGTGGGSRFAGQGRANTFGRSTDRRHGGGPGQRQEHGRGRPNRGGGRRGK